MFQTSVGQPVSFTVYTFPRSLNRKIFNLASSWAGSLNRDATADTTAAPTASKKTWIFKSFSRITWGISRAPSVENHRTSQMIDASVSELILEWSKNHPENHYLKIAILCVASEAASLNNLKIQLRTTQKVIINTKSYYALLFACSCLHHRILYSSDVVMIIL